VPVIVEQTRRKRTREGRHKRTMPAPPGTGIVFVKLDTS